MRVKSIQFRLTAWYATVLTVIFALLGIVLFIQLKRSVEGIVLETEARRARQIAETLVAEMPRTGEGRLAQAVEKFYAPEQAGRFIRVTRADGTPAYQSGPPNDRSFDPERVPLPAPGSGAPSARREPLADGSAVLLAAVPSTLPDGRRYTVEVGTSAGPLDRMLSRMSLLFGFGLPSVLLVAVGGGSLLVRRALRPVDRITRKAEGITQHNLGDRLPIVRTGDELERLAESLNHMITRLDDAFSNSKRFVADASHELRTPLTILRGELESLAQDPRTAAPLADRLGSLLEETERLSRIVEQLFALSRLDAGEAQSEWVLLDLGALAASTADQMLLLAEDRRIGLTCKVGQPVEVEGDRARLKQVVVNLLDNAIKYTAEGGQVVLSVVAAGSHAVLEVADTGIGISAEAQTHVFDRFYRADPSRSRIPDGAGLGLSIVKSICNAHAGEVDVQSEPGRGSVFRIRLPLANPKHLKP